MKKIFITAICIFLIFYCFTREKDKDNKIETVDTVADVTPVPDVKTEEEEALKKILEEMTLEEKVAQMFIIGYPEDTSSSYQPGGYIFFAKDFENLNPDSFRARVDALKSKAKIPVFIAVDEEGGTVTRASMYPQFRSAPFMSPQEIYNRGGMEAIASDAKEKSEFLLNLGINLNFAPVCDVSQNPFDYIYPRVFGKDAQETAEYVKTVVREMNNTGIGSVLKHFPGYGNNLDTHKGIAYDTRPYETFTNSDFIPFEAGIREGAGMVLVAHNVVNSIDPQLPASLSEKVHNILRDTLGFDGIIITDDLAMDAVHLFVDDTHAAIYAVNAGNDMICCTNFSVQITAIVNAVNNNVIEESRIDESVMRILKYKHKLGMIEI